MRCAGWRATACCAAGLRWRWAATASGRRDRRALLPRARVRAGAGAARAAAGRRAPGSVHHQRGPPAGPGAGGGLVGPRPPRRARGRPGARRGGALRRLPDRAEGRRDRHGRRARRSTRAPASLFVRNRPIALDGDLDAELLDPPRPMPETIVYNRAQAGLPYSKGLMAQQLSATGLSPERSFELARADRAPPRRSASERSIDVAAPVRPDRGGAARGGGRGRGPAASASWRRLDRLDRPLVVMIGGSTGVGKSTLATMLAGRLGITRVIATDVIRQVLRAFFTHESMPAVHHSAFEAGGCGPRDRRGRGPGPRGLRTPGGDRRTGVDAIVERACIEGTPIVLEGVHVVPGASTSELRERCVPSRRCSWWRTRSSTAATSRMRGAAPAGRALPRALRPDPTLQDHLAACARQEGVAVIDNINIDRTLPQLMDLCSTRLPVCHHRRSDEALHRHGLRSGSGGDRRAGESSPARPPIPRCSPRRTGRPGRHHSPDLRPRGRPGLRRGRLDRRPRHGRRGPRARRASTSTWSSRCRSRRTGLAATASSPTTASGST